MHNQNQVVIDNQGNVVGPVIAEGTVVDASQHHGQMAMGRPADGMMQQQYGMPG